MFRSVLVAASVLSVALGAAFQLQASQNRLVAMSEDEQHAILGADGWFEDCVDLDNGCIQDPFDPKGNPCPPGGNCGAYCPGGQVDQSCEDDWFSLGCTWIGPTGCDAEPLKCHALTGNCITAGLGQGPNPILCGSYDKCN